jgi:hypothetical protein
MPPTFILRLVFIFSHVLREGFLSFYPILRRHRIHFVVILTEAMPSIAEWRNLANDFNEPIRIHPFTQSIFALFRFDKSAGI